MEVDETYIGGLEKNKHAKDKLRAGRAPVGKAAVVGAKDRESNQVAARVIEHTDRETLRGFVDAHTSPEEMVYTDGSSAYKSRDRHESVKQTNL